MSSPEMGVGADLSRIQGIAECMPPHELAEWAKIRRGEPDVLDVLVTVCLGQLQAIHCEEQRSYREFNEFAVALREISPRLTRS